MYSKNKEKHMKLCNSWVIDVSFETLNYLHQKDIKEMCQFKMVNKIHLL